MLYFVKLIFSFISIISLAACLSSPISEEVAMEPGINKEFIKLLDYEIQNRAFALESMKVAVEYGEGEEDLPFKKAYLALEQLNQKHFAPIAEKYRLEMAPRLWTRTRTQAGLWISALMPETALKVIHSATLKYVTKLQELERLSKQEDKTFFCYVVAQEEVQAAAVGLVLDGEIELATNMLNRFVNDNLVVEFTSGWKKRNFYCG